MGEAVVEEVEGAVAQFVVTRVLHDLLAAAGPGEIDVQHFADAGRRAIGHHHQPVGQEKRLVDVVGDHQHGALLGVPDRKELLLQLLLGDRIEGAERFIEDQHLRPDRQGPGDRHPLLHAPGDLGDLLVGRFGEPHHRQVLQGDLALLGFRQVGVYRIDRQMHVLVSRHPGQQGVALEHHHPVGAWLGDRLTLQQHLAGAGGGEAEHHVEQGGFATAGMADHADEFPLGHLQVDVLQHGIGPARCGVDLAELLKAQQGRGVACA